MLEEFSNNEFNWEKMNGIINASILTNIFGNR